MLKSRKGGQTCGHLHVAEAEAWRCLDAQAEPSAWSVASACLTVKDKRPRRNMEYVVLLWAWMVMVPLVAALGAVALVVELVRQSWDMVFFSAVLLWCCLEAFSFGVECFREEIGRPRILDWMSRRCLPGEGR